MRDIAVVPRSTLHSPTEKRLRSAHRQRRVRSDRFAEREKGQPRISVVIPTLNEARNLPHVLPFIPASVEEIILVDGASTDDTVEVARRLIPSIRVVTESKPGKGAALCAGFEAATGDIIVMLDADGSTDPREIPRFVEALVTGADFAKGSRFLPDGGSTDISRLRSFGNAFFVLVVRALFGARYTDLCYGYNAFWRRLVPVLELDSVGFEIETVMNVRALTRGLEVAEVPSFEYPRIHGSSNLRPFRDGLRVLRAIVRERLATLSSPSWVPQPAGATDEAVDTLNLVPVMDGAALVQRRVAIPISPGGTDPALGAERLAVGWPGIGGHSMAAPDQAAAFGQVAYSTTEPYASPES